ncbi:uncharacterized protein LOC118222455 [Anguilla anguilla]|uniref:uncharacterized protein LOC118222455 n=1 Tax=Anguilla anguilla TaxID=7936 RepID=UPI0015ADD383|nr:uncharacterized protein LOC118222455 [Anguilla anguilla]
MELMSRSCDLRMEFCEAMAQWFRNYEAAMRANQQRALRNKGKSQGCPKVPVDRSSPHWLLHRLDCGPPPPEAQTWLSRVNVDQSEIMQHVGQTLLMVTDATGLPLGFDVVSVGGANPKGGAVVKGTNSQKTKDNGEGKMTERILGLLRHCMEAPMSGGAPRRPQILRVLDRKLHKLLRRSVDTVATLRLTLTSHAADDWGAAPAAEPDSESGGAPGGPPFGLRWPVMRHCHVCKRYAFACQLKPW